jgi:hypothetical protein
MTRVLALASLACLASSSHLYVAADDGPAAAVGAGANPAATTPAVSDTVAEWEFPQFAEGTKHSLDLATIPGAIRLDFLKTAVRQYVANRLNGLHTRHEKDEKVQAWRAYENATKADPLQSTVAKPTFDKPAEPDYQSALDNAFKDLAAGNVRKQGASDGPKPRKAADPLISTVTSVVVRAVFDSRKAADPKYTWVQAKAEVGSDGIAYLNSMIDAKVAAGGDRAALENARDEKYVKPARAMLGLDTSKKAAGLPSLL